MPVEPPSAADVADLRRRLDADARAWRRLELPTAIAVVVLGLAVAAGVGVHPALGALGAWLVGVGVVLIWARSVRDRTERGASPRGPAPRVVTLDGVPATALTAPGARIAVEVALWLWLALPLVGAGVALAAGGRSAAGLVLAALGAVCAVPPLLAAVGRISAGGVWLTSAEVVTRDRGLESRVGWARLAAVAEVRDGTVVLCGDVVHRRRSGPFGAGRGLPPGTAAADARWLALDAAALVRVLRHYSSPDAAAELGTPASLATIAAVAARP